MNLILHGYWRSSCSWRVRIVLNFKGLSAEYVPVHLVRGGGEQYYAEQRRINPMAQVPTLVVDGRSISQSVAIMEFLEETFPEPAMLPRDPYQRAKVRQLVEIVNSGIQPLQNLSVLKRLNSEGWDSDRVQSWAADWIRKGLLAYQDEMDSVGAQYSAGDSITLADAALVPQLVNARRFNVEFEGLSRLVEVETRLMNHPAFASTRPELQPDMEK